MDANEQLLKGIEWISIKNKFSNELQRLKRILRSNWKLKIGVICVSLFVLTAILPPLFINYSADVTKQHASDSYKYPSLKHPFGTDKFGRDIFLRVVWGTRIALYIGVSSALLGLLIGVPLGMFCGYWGGWRDQVLMRLNDALLSLPGLVLALIVISTLGSSVFHAIIAIGITFAPRISRVMRSCTLSLKNEEFVLAAKARGESDSYVIFNEILPNVWGPIVVEGGVRVSYAIVVGASLSFLGLGVQPPQPDWGLMIFEAREQIFMSPWTLIFPSLALISLTLSLNLLGDGLMDLLDYKEAHLAFVR